MKKHKLFNTKKLRFTTNSTVDKLELTSNEDFSKYTLGFTIHNIIKLKNKKFGIIHIILSNTKESFYIQCQEISNNHIKYSNDCLGGCI